MTPVNIKQLQGRLGVTADGIAGPVTWTAFFRKLGAKTGFAVPLANAAKDFFGEYGLLENAPRLIHFIGQCTVESDYWHAMEEYASGVAYEGRKDLGNTKPGYGKLYKGRGPIQTTGYNNYLLIGGQIGLDLVNHPELLSDPYNGMHASLQWWENNNGNKWADRDDARAVSRLVNRGSATTTKPANHEAERLAATTKARLLIA